MHPVAEISTLLADKSTRGEGGEEGIPGWDGPVTGVPELHGRQPGFRQYGIGVVNQLAMQAENLVVVQSRGEARLYPAPFRVSGKLNQPGTGILHR